MGEAVRTSTSTFGIWAIIVVAVVVLAVWLVGVSVADNIQARESRRWWRQLHAPEPALGSAGSPPVPGQPGGDEPGAERPTAAPEAVTGPIPAQGPAPAPETVVAGGRHARPTLDGAGDFRRDAADADWRTDLPAQAAPTGRHALPAQRTGDADRAERSLAGPDSARGEEDPGRE